jgi:hypothetical protein
MDVRTRPDAGANVSTLSLICLTVWLLGSVSAYTMGGFLHTFLIASVSMMLPRLIWGRRVTR